MAFKLRRDVAVAADPGRDDWQPSKIQQIPAGTSLDDVPAFELAQLAPEHFASDDGDALPEDWRTDKATLDHDRRQARNQAAEAKERVRRKAEKNKAWEG